MQSIPNAPPDLPPPSAEFMVILALAQAYARGLSRKERDRFLGDVSQALGLQAATLNVLRFRPKSMDPEVAEAMRQAQAWWAQAAAVALRLTDG